MVISEIRSDYCDEDYLHHTPIKSICEVWGPKLEQWHLKTLNISSLILNF